MTRPTDKPAWKWLGFAGHLIVSASCRFHLATEIGDVLVSTVGAYTQPGREAQWAEIGHDRKFETMVFPLGAPCDCGEDCGSRAVADWSNIDFDGYNTPAAAQAGHMAMCEKWAHGVAPTRADALTPD